MQLCPRSIFSPSLRTHSPNSLCGLAVNIFIAHFLSECFT